MPRQAKSVRAGTLSSVAPPPAPPKGRRELKRDAIVEAAKELFFAQGYERTSMDEIVARVGGSKATLYSHFPSKDDLLLALVEHMTQPAIAEALSVDPTQDFTNFLRALGRVTIRWLSSPDIIGMQRLAASEAIRFPAFGRTYYEQGILPGLQQGALLFKTAMDNGTLRQGDPLLAADHLIEMCAGWMWRRQIWNIAARPGENEIGSNVDAAVETFMRGYANTSARRSKRTRASPAARTRASPAAKSIVPGLVVEDGDAKALTESTQSRRDLKRRAIIAAAKALFFAEGYAAVTMSDIVARVGGSKSTLYSHFTSKSALLVAVVQDIEGGHTLEATGGGISATNQVTAPDKFRDWLTSFGRIAVARLTSPEFISLQRLAAAEATQLPEVGRTFFEAGVIPAFGQFVGYFAGAMESGVLRPAPPQLAAEHFIEMCTGWLMRRMIWGIAPPPTEAQISSQVDAAVETFLHGYSRIPSESRKGDVR